MDTNGITLRHDLTLIAAYLGLFVGLVDANAVNLALPAVRDDLGGGISGAQWTIDAYNITFAALLLSAGSLGDRFGRRRLLRIGLTVFVVASLACAAAPSLPLLLAARAVQGVGAALMLPQGLAITAAAFPDPIERGTGHRGVGDGGRDEHRDRADPGRRADRHHRLALHLLAERAGRSAGAADDAPLPARIPGRPGRAGRHRWSDAGGARPRHADDRPGRGTHAAAGWLVALAVVAVAGLAAFVVSQQRAAAPMLPLDLFRSRRLTAALVATFTMTFGIYGLLLVNSFVFQQQRGESALTTALWFLPMPITYLVLIPVVNAMAHRTGPAAADDRRACA